MLDSLCLSEDLDLVAFSNRNHGLLPGAGLTKLIANALRLGLNVNGVNLNDLYIEDGFDCLSNLDLVRPFSMPS
ncbi:MAG: hypothetical protein BHV62_02240 [Eggerthella sp. 51_9]|nr:MAG: hypothetical protein BHV62_02240 [Eggerthella sp. 51_9]